MFLSHDEHEIAVLLDLPSPTENRNAPDFTTENRTAPNFTIENRNRKNGINGNGYDQVDNQIQYAFGSRIPRR
jgi:hypothetical protein